MSTPAQTRVTTDLDVGWISREPEIAYVWNSSNPRLFNLAYWRGITSSQITN